MLGWERAYVSHDLGTEELGTVKNQKNKIGNWSTADLHPKN